MKSPRPDTRLPLAAIRTDGGTQPRAEISDEIVDEYTEALEDLPPVTVFYDGTTYWLADGFHRFRAHEKAGRPKIAADVKQGTLRDAVLFSVGANPKKYASPSLSFAETDRIITENRPHLDWVASITAFRAFPAIVHGTLAFAHPVDPAKVDVFSTAFLTNSGLRSRSPAWALQKYLFGLHGKTGYAARTAIALKTLCAIKREMSGKVEKVTCIREAPETLVWFRQRRRKLGLDSWVDDLAAK